MILLKCGIKKNGTNEPIYKTKIESRMQKTKTYSYQGGKGRRRGKLEIEMDIYTLLYIKQIANKNILSASLVVQMLKNLPAMQDTQVQSLGQKDPLEKGMATHPNIIAWRISWTEEPGGYSLWDHKDQNTTEELTHTQKIKTKP